jgi:hypothetical protein
MAGLELAWQTTRGGLLDACFAREGSITAAGHDKWKVQG